MSRVCLGLRLTGAIERQEQTAFACYQGQFGHLVLGMRESEQSLLNLGCWTCVGSFVNILV